MSEAGLEPAKPASLAQYLCQFGYSDMNCFWSPERGSNPQDTHFKCASYASSDTGSFGVPTRIRTGKLTALNRSRLPFRHKDIWSEQKESNLRHVVPGHGYFRYTTPR